jgi:enoyl-CoA hydratase
VQVGLVAADGGPLTWPLHISLLLAKEYALTGARISAQRAVELGLANHAVADPLEAAIKAAKKILELPQQAVEATKRVLNVHLERAVLATIDYALSAENQSMQTEDFRNIVAKFNAGKN